MTPLERRKLHTALSDPKWRVKNLYAIEDKYGTLVPFKPNKAQRFFFSGMHPGGNMILKARQMGLSTGIIMFIWDKLLFASNLTAGIVDRSLVDAESKLRKILVAYENLDNPVMPFSPIGAFIKERVKIERANSQMIKFSNGSIIQAGRSLRGGTTQYLHISELGKIAMEDPKKAEEIKSGALNTIAPGNHVFAESTHEGGRVGMHYKLLKASMENDPNNLSPVDMKFHFFPWFYDPTYSIDAFMVTMRPEITDYFEKLERDHGVKLTANQRAWYDRKERQQGEAMLKEYPSTPEEAMRSSNAGAIYAKLIAEARAEGRICNFKYDASAPVVTSWDLGMSDYTSIWALQFVGREVHWIDWYEASGEPPNHFAAKMREWDQKYGNIAMHYLPHDAAAKGLIGTSYVQKLAECGIDNVSVVPVTPDIWLGINNLRDIIKRSVFHLTNCGTPRRDEGGEEHPSGIDCLEAYRTKSVDAAGKISESPVHDETSHACDAARTISEAVSRGMVGRDGSFPSLRQKGFKPVVITGAGASSKKRRTARVS